MNAIGSADYMRAFHALLELKLGQVVRVTTHSRRKIMLPHGTPSSRETTLTRTGLVRNVIGPFKSNLIIVVFEQRQVNGDGARRYIRFLADPQTLVKIEPVDRDT